jgi:hypothetical protein
MCLSATPAVNGLEAVYPRRQTRVTFDGSADRFHHTQCGNGCSNEPRYAQPAQQLNAALVDLAEPDGALVAAVHGRFLGHGVSAGDPTTCDSRPAKP